MKRLQLRMAKSLVIAMLVFGAAAGINTVQAHDQDDCEAPLNDWQPRDAVREMARQKGWQIDKLKVDDGCYEVKGRDVDGRRFKAKIDPVTLEVVRMKRGDGHSAARSRAPYTNTSKPLPGAPSDGLAKPAMEPQVEIR